MTDMSSINLSCLDQFEGLCDLVQTQNYRSALDLPDEVVETYEPLARGEYNVNFTFIHPKSKKRFVLRVNLASQMHLENQIAYEYNALKLLESSNRTPHAYYCDATKSICKNGILVEEFLTGKPLHYDNDLDFFEASRIFADIHSISVSNNCGLIKETSAYKAIFDESVYMANIYLNSSVATHTGKKLVESTIAHCENVLASANYSDPRISIVNSEVNSSNFLMNGESTGYLIDWEKPILGDVAQDLGHFLADTTTLWKSEVLIAKKQKSDFMDSYIEAVNGRFVDDDIKARALDLAEFTKLRGITWCAMAYSQHIEGIYTLSDEYTLNKCKRYLEDYFV